MIKKEMVKEINKYAVTGLFWGLALTSLGGCIFPTYAETAPADAPEPTEMVTPTAKPTPTASPTAEPTPTPEPTPTHEPELSLEEERELLGVKEKNEIVELKQIAVMFYTQKDDKGNDITKIAWITIGADLNDNIGLYNVWGKEKLYSIPKDASNEVWKFSEIAIPSNIRLEGSKIIKIYPIFGLRELYKKMGVDFELPEEMLSILALSDSKQQAYSLPMEQFMDLYIACTPKEYRTSWKDFDEALVERLSPASLGRTVAIWPNSCWKKATKSTAFCAALQGGRYDRI